jgi:hypothetical protein
LYEQRGDVRRQAEILTQALAGVLTPAHIQDVLSMTVQNARAYQVRHPEPCLVPEQSRAGVRQMLGPQLVKEVLLPRESGAEASVSWFTYAATELAVLDIQANKLQLRRNYATLTPSQRGILLNSSYASLNVADFESDLQRIILRSLFWPAIPIEPVHSQPVDFFFSARHPFVIAADRGAGKLHFIQRDPLRLARSWKVVNRPGKKAMSVAFHPDGRRVFVTSPEAPVCTLIDRGLTQKKIPLPGLVVPGNLAVNSRGDQLLVLSVSAESHRPDLLIYDTEKYQLQQTLYLEGEAFSNGADARDLLEISPDGRWAVVMVSVNQPALFTPCLLLIDLTALQIVDRLLLTAAQKPANLAFLARQLFPPQFRLLSVLRHQPGVTAEILHQAFGPEAIEMKSS